MAESHTLNGIGHFDVAGPDLTALSGFYSGLFGWQVTPRGPGYAQLATPGGLHGAIVEAETASLTLAIVVPDLEAALACATEHGGEVAMPVLDNGWVKKAQLRDPAGNLLTLIEA